MHHVIHQSCLHAAGLAVNHPPLIHAEYAQNPLQSDQRLECPESSFPSFHFPLPIASWNNCQNNNLILQDYVLIMKYFLTGKTL